MAVCWRGNLPRYPGPQQPGRDVRGRDAGRTGFSTLGDCAGLPSVQVGWLRAASRRRAPPRNCLWAAGRMAGRLVLANFRSWTGSPAAGGRVGFGGVGGRCVLASERDCERAGGPRAGFSRRLPRCRRYTGVPDRSGGGRQTRDLAGGVPVPAIPDRAGLYAIRRVCRSSIRRGPSRITARQRSR